MGVRQPSVFSNTVLGTTPASGAETVVVTSPPIAQTLDGSALLIQWYVEVTVGAGSTAATVRVRRGTSVAGVNIKTNPNTTIFVTAANGAFFSGVLVDNGAGAAMPQYSVSIQGLGTTGAWTTLDSWIVVTQL